MRSEGEHNLLIIGYGNELRGDDAVGPQVARTAETWGLPGLHIRVEHQLTPELADLISRFPRVLFVDCSVEEGGLSEITEKVGDSLSELTHTCSPDRLLWLSRVLYGRVPRAWLLSVQGHSFQFGESLSAGAEREQSRAINSLRHFVKATINS